jgi:hypothetical protein
LLGAFVVAYAVADSPAAGPPKSTGWTTTRFFARREPTRIYHVVESLRAERIEDIPYRVSVILKKAIINITVGLL